VTVRQAGPGFRLEVSAHAKGRLGIPASGRVTLDGHVVWAGGKATAKGVTSDGTYVYADGVAAGRHTMEGMR
jgi:phage baseplate assembly protein gpV